MGSPRRARRVLRPARDLVLGLALWLTGNAYRWKVWPRLMSIGMFIAKHARP